VLQFQSRGTLAATSGPLGAVGTKPAGAVIGVEGIVCDASDAAEPEDWLLLPP